MKRAVWTVLFAVGLGPTLCAGCGGSATKPPQTLELVTPLGVAMVGLPGGAFTMGANDSAADEAPRHQVTVSAFAIDKFEVTQEQYALLQLPNPSHFKAPKRPVEQVRWSDAALFCNERSKQEGLEPCYDDFSFACNFEASGYRLPTEAEWEFAARAGSDGAYDFGNDPLKLNTRACYAATSKKKTGLVGKKKPNAWGLHDMHGNVLEWCHDVYGAGYYTQSSSEDPRGPTEGKKRVMRGGAWNSSAEACRVSARLGEIPGITDACFARDTFGFRCVRRLTPEEEKALAGLGQLQE